MLEKLLKKYCRAVHFLLFTRSLSIHHHSHTSNNIQKRSVFLNQMCSFFPAFTLCKENLETLEAISYMSASLGVLPSDFTYAGIKDKRAVTYQSMVVKKVSPQR